MSVDGTFTTNQAQVDVWKIKQAKRIGSSFNCLASSKCLNDFDVPDLIFFMYLRHFICLILVL